MFTLLCGNCVSTGISVSKQVTDRVLSEKGSPRPSQQMPQAVISLLDFSGN